MTAMTAVLFFLGAGAGTRVAVRQKSRDNPRMKTRTKSTDDGDK